MELQLGLALPIQNPMKSIIGFEPFGLGLDGKKYVKSKRNFDEAFEKIHYGDVKPTLLPLLLWNDEPNEEDDRKEHKKRASNNINKIEGDENQITGWPPIESWRKKLFSKHQVRRIQNDRTTIKERGKSNTTYVKVKMDGVAIGRKIDIKLYQSYETLLNAIINLFYKYQESDKIGTTDYTLTYLDKEGDWLLAGDVPWQTFIESVQRLEILRKREIEWASWDAYY